MPLPSFPGVPQQVPMPGMTPGMGGAQYGGLQGLTSQNGQFGIQGQHGGFQQLGPNQQSQLQGFLNGGGFHPQGPSMPPGMPPGVMPPRPAPTPLNPGTGIGPPTGIHWPTPITATPLPGVGPQQGQPQPGQGPTPGTPPGLHMGMPTMMDGNPNQAQLQPAPYAPNQPGGITGYLQTVNSMMGAGNPAIQNLQHPPSAPGAAPGASAPGAAPTSAPPQPQQGMMQASTMPQAQPLQRPAAAPQQPMPQAQPMPKPVPQAPGVMAQPKPLPAGAVRPDVTTKLAANMRRRSGGG